MELQNRTAIVTGAGRGIGRALAREFARQGAKVVCAARSRPQLEETVGLITNEGGRALAVPTDVTRQDQVEALMRRSLDHFGSVDVLFNNAGSFAALGAVWEVDPQVWWRDVTVNLLGTMLCCRAVLPHMLQQQQGVIINMTGGNQIPGGTGYSCSKVAVNRFTELLAKEVRTQSPSVFVFTMGPGFVRTEMTEYQVTTPEGRKWLPSSQQAFEQHQDVPPELCAACAVQLLGAAGPALNGKAFYTGPDFQRQLVQTEV